MGESDEPFRAKDAIARGGVSDHHVRHHCRRVLPGIYMHSGGELTAFRRAKALALWAEYKRWEMPLAGFSAAAVWGAKWIDSDEFAACNYPYKLREPDEVTVYRDRLEPEDVCELRGVLVTSPVRTAFDLARRLTRGEAVAAVDALYQTGRVTKRRLARYTDRHPRCRNVRYCRKIVELSDEGAESPQETKTRLALVDAGLPRPESQCYVLGIDGVAIGRVDLCWRRWRVIVEYEGDGHRASEQFAKDLRRWNALSDAGWTVVRVKSEMLEPEAVDVVVGQVRRALRRAGADV